MALFPKHLGVLEQAMRAATVRHQVIANNIANANVPGFQASEVTFEEQLREVLEGRGRPAGLTGLRTHERHLPIGEAGTSGPVAPQIRPVTGTMIRKDGNNVDPEAEMAKLAANQLWYQALVRSISDEFTRLRTAILDGRR